MSFSIVFQFKKDSTSHEDFDVFDCSVSQVQEKLPEHVKKSFYTQQVEELKRNKEFIWR